MAASAQDLPRLGPDNLFASTPARLLEQAIHRPDAIAYKTFDGADWVGTSWAEYGEQVKQAARALIALGHNSDNTVAILGFNRPEWTIMAIAAMMAGGRPAGVYWTSAPPEIAYILEHSEAPFYLVENADQARTAIELRANLASLKTIIVMDGWSGDEEGVYSWEDFLAKGETHHQGELVQRMKAIEAESIGALIYTSGTTGPPKAVMLSHGNASWASSALMDMFKPEQGDTNLSYLPIAHVAEQQSSVHNHVLTGSTLYFSRGLDYLAEDLKAARPSVFFGVPRVWEKMYETLRARLDEATGTKAKLAKWAMGVSGRWHDAYLNGKTPGPLLNAEMGLARALVLNKIKDALGLDRSRMLISGAAPISVEVLRFFASIDLMIYEGYGQSETSAPTTFNQPGSVRIGSVGRLVEGMQARISEDGELQVKGPNVFAGYMKNNEATENTFTRDGWMKTGDVVRQDEDGFYYITGRIKDIIITSGGKNITPANIETDLMNDALIEHAVVIGDAKPYLSALLTLSEESLAKFAQTNNMDVETARTSQVLEAHLQAAVDRTNENYARVENVRKFRVLPQPLSVENGELTPTMKVRRNVVTDRNLPLIEAMYTEKAGSDEPYR